MLEIWAGNSLVWVLIHQHPKSVFLQVTLILNWSKWILVVDILTQMLLTLLTFIGLLILQKVLLCVGWFLFGVSNHVIFQFTHSFCFLFKHWLPLTAFMLIRSLIEDRHHGSTIGHLKSQKCVLVRTGIVRLLRGNMLDPLKIFLGQHFWVHFAFFVNTGFPLLHLCSLKAS